MNNGVPRRLIEVDLPIKRISEHARREKSIRHGHISTLHIWWARRPLAACRAVLCAALWPDPADPECPIAFRQAAAIHIVDFARQVMAGKVPAESCSEASFGRWNTLARDDVKLDADNPGHQNQLRYALLDFIADYSNWDNSTVKAYLETSRALTQAAHEALGGAPGTRPLVVDPFAGGGAIPLEALRVGADAFASDLNPVAVLLNKVVLEYIPKYGNATAMVKNAEGKEITLRGLAEIVRFWGSWIKEHAELELSKYYPSDPDGATPIAYLWARTIRCEGPGCGAEVPLIRSLWLAKRTEHSVALRLVPDAKKKHVNLAIIHQEGGGWFSSEAPKSRINNPQFDGTVKRGSATCPVCGYTTPVSRVREQLTERHGGANDARLLCIVTIRQDDSARYFRLPTKRDLAALMNAKDELDRRQHAHQESLTLVPDEPTPNGGGNGAGRAFSQRIYGMNRFGDLFTYRQLLALTTLARLVREVGQLMVTDKDKSLADSVQTCLALALDRVADRSSTLCRYDPSPKMSGINNTFSRPTLSMIWDFGEGDVKSGRSGGWEQSLEWLTLVLQHETSVLSVPGIAQLASATSHPLPDDSSQCFFTDPPYYDAVPYSDLSDFFYVWLKRALSIPSATTFSSLLTPKEDECIVDEIKGKNREYFEQTMGIAMAEGRRVLAPDGIGIVVFAHKSTSGWEAQLKAMIDAGWVVTGSWPIDTEMGTRLRAHDSAALASSVHLVCRPRAKGSGDRTRVVVGDWRDILTELPRRIKDWMPHLAQEGVVGADAIFACLGPALEIFSRYERVEKADGTVIALREYLEQVWAAVGCEALNQIFAGADPTGFEEDGRLTALWLWTLSGQAAEIKADTGDDDEVAEGEVVGEGSKAATGGFMLDYDTARKLAQGIGAHLEDLDRPSSVVAIKGDKARLLGVGERRKHLLGALDGDRAEARPAKNKRSRGAQMAFEAIEEAVGPVKQAGGSDGKLAEFKAGETTLDRIHQSMLLFGEGRSEALKRFLVEDGAGQDQRFWRLAQTLSALYPSSSQEKRWVDGVLARKKGLGL